jgi:hypothetical protein
MSSRDKLDSKLTPFQQRMNEPLGLRADGSIKVYTPAEFEAEKAAAKLRWQRGFDDAMAHRERQLDAEGRASPDYFEGYDAGEERRASNNSVPSK